MDPTKKMSSPVRSCVGRENKRKGLVLGMNMVDKVPNLITMFDSRINAIKLKNASPDFIPIMQSVIPKVVERKQASPPVMKEIT